MQNDPTGASGEPARPPPDPAWIDDPSTTVTLTAMNRSLDFERANAKRNQPPQTVTTTKKRTKKPAPNQAALMDTTEPETDGKYDQEQSKVRTRNR